MLGHQLIFRQLLEHPVWVGALFIDFVHRHNNGHVGGFGVVDGFHGLRHDAVVGGHHQNGHVGDLGAAGAHRGKGRVAWGIQKGNQPLIQLHLVSADMLGDAAGFATGDI